MHGPARQCGDSLLCHAGPARDRRHHHDRSLNHRDAIVVIQEAWLAEKVPQCGYCRSGQIMAAVALLGHLEDPDDTDIALAMAGRLCRHDAYPRIRTAIKRAAAARKAARSPGSGAPAHPDSPSS
jgi:xanthine dehydrogenase iron-sulfur cluster and FAD-binding subunit A